MRKLSSVIVVVILLLLSGCGVSQSDLSASESGLKTESYTREPYRLELTYPADELVFGSTAEIILKIVYPETQKYILLPPAIDSSGSTANTVIVSIDESEPVLYGDGTAESTITFNVEAWLPGKLVFPSLRVSFGEVLTTDELIINVASAFYSDEDERELSHLYIPEPVTSAARLRNPAVVGLGAGLIAAVILLIIFIRRRKNKTENILPERTLEEMISDFKKSYIETNEDIDLRAAFSDLDHLTGLNEDEHRRALINKARFSRTGMPGDEGRNLLIEIFNEFIKESHDEL